MLFNKSMVSRIKVPKEDYDKIFERYKSGEKQRSIAADYNVSQSVISFICRLCDDEINW